MSDRVPAAAGLAVGFAGLGFAGAGLWARRDVKCVLAQERIESPVRGGRAVAGPTEARELADFIRRNTLEATGGRTYAAGRRVRERHRGRPRAGGADAHGRALPSGRQAPIAGGRALWNSRADGVRELELPRGAAALLLATSVEQETLWTADGRRHADVPSLRLSDVQPLRSDQRLSPA